ncbi:type II secretion system secretin GspD [Methylibium petroleiphilum]|uniref:type II secretion system secretin GspD n=2 Tax=Methylibium petroleiphilum TaxID=105560 RepID=UPI001ACA17CE|nr:type II secretion system secretin GspD [Methylibium petroleiphilum]MBN9204624.1 type II secretion system secretin GspD [Methylibium petroleiphilum]
MIMSLTTSPKPARRATALRALAAACAVSVALGSLAPPALAQKTKTREPVTLNFVNAEIEGVARAIGAILERQIVIDPRVKGQITLYSEQPLSPREAYLNFLAALRGLGFTVVEVAGLLKVVPEADAKLQTGTVSVGNVTRQGDQIITQIFRLNHENANNLVAVLRPLISPNNTINANPGNNSLVITDYADNLQRIAKVIATVDVPAATDVEVIPLQHAVASDIAVLVQRLSDAPAATAGSPAAAAGGGGLSVIADSRTNALLVRASNPAKLAQVRSLVAKLDQPGTGGAGGSNIYVVYLKNADATRLAQVLRAAFTSNTSSGSGGSVGGAASPVTNLSNQANAQLGNQTSGTGAAPQTTNPVSAAAQPSTGGFIQADPATNALIITAAEPMYRQLRSVIDQLDARRAQVYVETMIVEVNATKAADAGIQWQGLIGKDGDKTGLIGGTNFGTGGDNIINLSIAAAQGGTAVSGNLPSAGLNLGVIRRFAGVYTLGALARFLETNADGNILSTPNLVTLDNEEAKIVVGQNVPFVTGSFTSTGTGSGATNPFQTIERKDVGITLRVKPQIGENGTVRMTVYQEASSVVNQNVSQGVADATAGLVTNKRSIESTVVVNDGDILVMGGLMQDQFQDNSSRVPGLGRLPGIGALFRSDNRTRTKSNLMVFLRPQVMRSAENSNALSLDRYDLIRAQQQNSQPESRVLLPNFDIPVLPPLRPPPGEPMPPAPTPPASPPLQN